MVTDDIIEMLRSRVGSAFDGEATFSEDEIEKIVSALSSSPAPVAAGDWYPTHRHKKRGTHYQHIGTALIQSDVPLSDLDVVEIYAGREGDLWARRQSEFYDGRFGRIATTPTPPAPAQPTSEPVAWQWRHRAKREDGTYSEWSDWREGRNASLRSDIYEVEERPLCAAPAHVAADAQVPLPPVGEIDALIERLLDAQQDINLSANETMSQPLCDASALIDEVETLLVRLKSALAGETERTSR